VAESVVRVGEALERARLVAIIRLDDHSQVVEIATTLVDAGVTFLEVTLERPEGFDALERVVDAVGERAVVGAGTVLRVADIVSVSSMGAQFVVSPNSDPDVIAAGLERNLLMLPGALTPTEIALATSAGATYVKLFPAGALGVEYLRALRAPFPDVKFMPTGGVTLENARSWLDADAAAVAMGSQLVPASGALEGLFERATEAVRCVALE
jgi:Entner-Doudoroff aldolase